MKNKLLLLFLLVSFFSSLAPLIHAEISAHYSVIDPELHSLIQEARKDNYVGGEWDHLEDGNFIVIPFIDYPKGGDVFEVFFHDIDLPGFEGYKYPELRIIGEWITLLPRVETEFREYEDGTKVCYGYTQWYGQTIYMYAWGEKSDSTSSTVTWKVAVTWGDNAGVNDPGNGLDRLHLGTLVKEEEKFPFNILQMEMLAEQPILKISYDAQAWFWLETSTDLKTWKKMSYYLFPLQNTEHYQGGVKYIEGTVLPIFSPLEEKPKGQFFRLVERN